jgi:MFS family permease
MLKTGWTGWLVASMESPVSLPTPGGGRCRVQWMGLQMGGDSVFSSPMAQGLTRQQKLSLIAAWLGWAFDGLDGYLYVMVAVPFVSELVRAEHGLTKEAVAASAELTKNIGAEVSWKAATIQAVFLGGWALGGAFFGRIGDRLGRSRTLTLTILTYACFTGLSFFATRWWHLLIFRFLAALGIGGEWAAGSALVSETLDPKHKHWASATLQSGYMVGCIAAALTASWMGSLPPRWVFLVGITPAILTLGIRKAVPEPEEWKSAAKARVSPPLSAIFSPQLLRTTLLTTALTSVALTTVWSLLFFANQCVERIGAAEGFDAKRTADLKMHVTVVYLLVNIAGNYFATYLARALGYRWAFGLLFAASIGIYLGLFRSAPTLENVYWVMSVAAFFSLGLFGLFPLYIPPLYPTLVRTLGAGFTYNAGRLVSGGGTFALGWIVANAGGPHAAIWWTGFLFIPGVVVACFISRGGVCAKDDGG